MTEGATSGTAPLAAAWTYRPALDGLRTLAVYIVIAFHAGIGTVTGGFIGVDLFFVLSGFLVTSVLLVEHESKGRIGLARFYARRVRRLLPAAVVTIVAVAILAVFLEPPLTRQSYVDSARSALLYVSNWHFVGQATDYFAADVNADPLLHFWSLSVEEQFYVGFPVVLIGLLALARRLRTRAIVIGGLVALTAASLVVQLLWADRDPLRAYYGTDARVYQMLAGAALAVLAASATAQRLRGALARSSRLVADIGLGVAVAAFVLVASDVVSMSPSTRGIVAAGVAVAAIAVSEVAAGPVSAIVSAPIPTFLGRISYSTYLWHWPLLVYLRKVLDLSAPAQFVVAAVGASAMAALSFVVLESPIRAAPALARWPKPVVTAGLSVSALTALLVAPALLETDRPPIIASGTGEVGVLAATTTAPADVVPSEAVVDPAATAGTVPPGIDLAAAAAYQTGQVGCRGADPQKCVLHEGGGRHLFLLGDSNAAIFVPMFRELAAEHDFTFSATTAAGCPWQEGLGWEVEDRTLLDECIATRDDVYDRVLPALAPDIVVTVNISRDDPAREAPPYTALDESLGSGSGAVAEATARTLDRLQALGANVVMLEPVPYELFDPVACLSGVELVADCAIHATTQPIPSELIYRYESLRRDGVSSVDVDEIACPGKPLCLPIIAGELIYRDAFHLYPPFLIDHREEYWAAIEASAALA